jgi:hypothetical protein
VKYMKQFVREVNETEHNLRWEFIWKQKEEKIVYVHDWNSEEHFQEQ